MSNKTEKIITEKSLKLKINFFQGELYFKTGFPVPDCF